MLVVCWLHQLGHDVALSHQISELFEYVVWSFGNFPTQSLGCELVNVTMLEPNLSPKFVSITRCVKVYQAGCLESVCVLLDHLTLCFGFFWPFLRFTLKNHYFSLLPSSKTVLVWCFLVWWPPQSPAALRLVYRKDLLHEILKPLVTSITFVSSIFWKVVKFWWFFQQIYFLRFGSVRGHPDLREPAIFRSLSQTYKTTFYLRDSALGTLFT